MTKFSINQKNDDDDNNKEAHIVNRWHEQMQTKGGCVHVHATFHANAGDTVRRHICNKLLSVVCR